MDRDGPTGHISSQEASFWLRTDKQHPETRNRYSCESSPAQHHFPQGSLPGSPRPESEPPPRSHNPFGFPTPCLSGLFTFIHLYNKHLWGIVCFTLNAGNRAKNKK